MSIRCCVVVGVLVLSSSSAVAEADSPWSAPAARFVEAFCYDCHRGSSAEAGLNLAGLGTDLSNADVMRRWMLIHDRVAAGEMPPEDATSPKVPQRQAFVRDVAAALVAADARREVVLRRLNRVEYENTIRDLFGVRVDLVDLLPEDATAHGFDNIGAALAVSTEQMQVYLTAADAALDEVFGADEEPARIDIRFPLAQDTERHHGNLFQRTDEGVVLFSSGYCPSAFRSFRPKTKGTYRVTIHAKAYQTDRPVVMAVYGGDVIAKRRERHLVGHYGIAPGDDWTTVEFTDYIDRYDSFQPIPFKLSHRKNKRFEGIGLLIGDVEIEGPLASWPPPSRARLLGDVDPLAATLDDARAILGRILPRAYRRATQPEEVSPYVELVKTALDQGRPFEDALRVGLKAILCSPGFLFLEETTSGPEQAISDYALASRLSYFLTSSMPDATLLSLADQGKLSDRVVLRSQVERMLAAPRAAAFTRNFTDQWLDLRDIDFTEPDGKLYPEFDDLLKASMVAESRRFFQEILDHDRSLLEFVDADWTILNQRLAEHYGVEGVTGQALRRVALPPESVRGGVLTQAAVLKVTANGTNTSPVVRGVWVLENVIGRPTSPPPPDVPAIEPDIRGATTIREQLDKHRNTTACAACHAKIDPPGFALESFDVIGGRRAWYRSAGEGERVDRYIDNIGLRRVLYKRGPDVDCTGVLPDGRRFQDIRDFKRLLLTDPDQIARCLTEKVLTYALGRGLGFSDRRTVEEIVNNVRKKNYGFRTLMHEVVQSEAFWRP